MYYYTDVEFAGNIKRLIAKKDEDGNLWWLASAENDVYYLEWLEAGNQPEEWIPDAAE